MLKKLFAPKVLHKSLILVLLPLVIQTLFFFELGGVVSRAEQMALAERKQSTVVEQVNWLIAIFMSTSSQLGTYIITGHKNYGKEGRRSLLDLQRQFDELERLLADSPKQLGHVKQMRQLVDVQLRDMEALQPTEERDSFSYLWSHMKEFRETMQEVGQRSGVLMHMISAEKDQLAQMRQEEVKTRQNVKDQIIFGMIFNFVLVAVMLIWFINNITGRLKMLVENARQLPSGQPLVNTVKGDDELAYLDGVLHSASVELRKAAEHRQSLMEMVAHDLRSPLMSCQVSMQILSSDKMPELPPIATRQITSVQNNIKRVVEMVSDLLTIEKLEAGKLELELETIDIQDMVAEAMDSLMALAREKKVTMSNDCASELIQGDRKRLVQVLLNFMSNAIKFSPSGSNISVYSSRQGNIVSIGVEDRGPGLEPEDQEHIFEKFYQAEDGQRSKGFGLGLAICKLLVEAHGGEVGVDSEPGQGSVFWLSLPASPEQ
ncbi:MAG: CHASE3 domain-containing protein [Candidatus Obscuribacter sp.]|jgi:signal transduction histidine kinase|nr:CHASE3 domain-containing protein [Candidatus Obscuribacter sp.]MBK9619252.1 CHASE3 domain-containing protein [Candidatus Obscuribacter sp.]